ncbi:MAG TPA: peptide chain release factor N(5)-glutamine methyltransferase [Bacilli bacterium]|nr:peptide chain release factor N(5)-glutamine methyltransferase [Bacilli bacterium]
MTAYEILQHTIKDYPHLSVNDIRLALMHITKSGDYTSFILNQNKKLNLPPIFFDIVKRLNNNEPIQYILEEAFFYDENLYVNKHVLIPRIETEELVHKLIEEIKNDPPIAIADIGTGSGAIAVTLAKHTDHQIYASDISKRALKVAERNDRQNKVQFIHGDLLLPFINNNITLDYIVANLPYIEPEEEISDNVKNFEPHLALFLPKNNIFARFFRQVKRVSKGSNGVSIFMEIGSNQGEELLKLAYKILGEDEEITVHQDMYGKDRFLIIRGLQ